MEANPLRKLVTKWRQEAEQKGTAAAAYEGQNKWGRAIFSRGEESAAMRHAYDLEAALNAQSVKEAPDDTPE